MKFTSAGLVEQVIWDMRQADLPRGTNRAAIDRIANGLAPLTQTEAIRDNAKTNVNFLDFPKLCADARRTYYGAFLKPNIFFNVTLDSGPVHKRQGWGKIITKSINDAMKSSKKYFEMLRSQFALTVLHGIGPAFWPDKDHWCPECVGIEDVMIPSNTLISMENLNYFAVFRQYTPMELYKITHGPHVDPGWNMDVVDGALDWVNQQTQAQKSYSELYAPQKIEEYWHQDLGFFGTDSVPTVDAWDFYFWSDEEKVEGWRRRMVLDTPATGEVRSRRYGKQSMPSKNGIGKDHGQWLYRPSDDRIYADKIDSIIHFQFGDASSVAPFRYHSVRSLGWLLYGVCHLQNRMRCRLTDSIFESLQQYFRVSNPTDKERVTKIDLHNYGVVPEGINFVPQQERWKVDHALAGLGLTLNRESMNEAAAQYREGRETDKTTEKEKTATQVMAEVNAANALVGSMLLQAYEYARFQFTEVARRFCLKDSIDMDVREFRNQALKSGIPEELLDVSRWNIEPERAMGSGNKILQVAMADKLMATRQLHDPESQREILHIYDVANTDDPDLADRLVPTQENRITSSVKDAQLAIGSLMQGIPIAPVPGQNPVEMIETLLHGMASILQRIQSTGQPALMNDIIGLSNVGQSIAGWIQLLAQDKESQPQAKQYQSDLDQLMKLVTEMGKKLQEAQSQQAQVGGNGQIDPKDQAKVAAMMIQAQAKANIAERSNLQRTSQRQRQFEQKIKQDEQKHTMDMAKKLRETQIDTAAKDLTTAAEIRHSRLRALSEPTEKPKKDES